MDNIEIYKLFITAAFSFGLFGLFINDLISQFKRKDRVLKAYFEKCFKRNLDDDINEKIIKTIKSGFTIKNIKYSVVNIVSPNGLIEVIVEAKAYDYGIKKRVIGYFSLEYFYVPELEEFHISSRQSRSMSIETKLAADIPYGGWFKDDRQIEDEKNYLTKRKNHSINQQTYSSC